MPAKVFSIRIDGELVKAAEGQTILEAARARREIHPDALLPGRVERGGRLPPMHRAGVRHRPAAARLHHAGAGRHVGDDQFAQADRVPAHGGRAAAGRAQSRVRGVRFERALRAAIHGAIARRDARALPVQLSEACRWTCRTSASCSITTAASCARAACAFARKWKERTCGKSLRAAFTRAW